MADETLELIIEAARAGVKDRPTMVSDGNPQEELARAFERHADRVQEVADNLLDVSRINNLGPTNEGEAATHNIRLGVVEHDRSLYHTLAAQAAEARSIAVGLRDIGRQILRTEGASEESINRVIGH